MVVVGICMRACGRGCESWAKAQWGKRVSWLPLPLQAPAGNVVLRPAPDRPAVPACLSPASHHLLPHLLTKTPQVIDDSDSSDSDDNKPLSAALAGRRPLSTRNNAGAAPPPSAAATCTAAACPTGAVGAASVASPAAASLPPRPPKCEILELDLTSEMDDDIVCQAGSCIEY